MDMFYPRFEMLPVEVESEEDVTCFKCPIKTPVSKEIVAKQYVILEPLRMFQNAF
jgi:hypothetical protein